MLRHRKTLSSAIAAAVLASGALSLAAGAGANPTSPDDTVTTLADEALHDAPEAMPAPEALPEPAAEALPAPEALPEPAAEALPAPEGLPEPAPEALPAPEGLPDPAPEALPGGEALGEIHLDQAFTVVHVGGGHRLLAAGVCNERGLQVKTIEVERAVSAEFPQIKNMIGVRPDSKPWHPNGLAVDIMIPNPGSAEGVALGNAIRDYALHHVAEFDLQDVIWRGTYYTPAGPSGSGYGHFDHVHITTHGGGFPSGAEEYIAP